MDGRSVSSGLVGDLRRSQGLTQRALAERSGIPQPTIAEVEAGRREPSLSLLSRIAESIGQTIDISLVPLLPFSAVATSKKIAERLFDHLFEEWTPELRQDGALRAILDLRDALRQSNAVRFNSLVKAPPNLTGDSRWDAFVAAVVEDESARKGVAPPRWTNDPTRFVKPFWYLSDIPELHPWEFRTAPAAFVRHGVLAAEEELESV
jgi:transcriptional regulator with XRE-family HTH domain